MRKGWPRNLELRVAEVWETVEGLHEYRSALITTAVTVKIDARGNQTESSADA